MAERLTATVGDDVSQRAAQVKDKLSEIARTAADTIEENRSKTAHGLDTAASALRDHADALPGGEPVNAFAHAAADRLTTTADYVRKHDVNRMVTDMQSLVRHNPGPSLAVAAVFGFLVGRAIRRG